MTRRGIPALVLLAFVALSCDQPFVPDGPAGNKLVVYGILNVEQTTQFVRLEKTTSGQSAAPVKGAAVTMTVGSSVVQFHDTTMTRRTLSGGTETIELYVANNVKVQEGATYLLEARTSEGMSGTSRTTALKAPGLDILQPGALVESGRANIGLETQFRNATGAWVMHFTIEYYALVNGGWELRHEEVPEREYTDEAGNIVNVYPVLSPVPSSPTGTSTANTVYDTTLYEKTRMRISAAYPAAPVVWMYAVFTVTQVDNNLYTYFYVNNGLVDQTSIRLEQRDYTNITGGLGVFGSSATVTQRYDLRK